MIFGFKYKGFYWGWMVVISDKYYYLINLNRMLLKCVVFFLILCKKNGCEGDYFYKG